MPKWFWINKLVFLSGQKHVVCSGTPGWCAWVLALRQQPLYDRSAHSRFTICLYFIWHRDIRARKVWVHDMIHMRRKYGELYSFTLDKKEKERQWRHQCLSENLNLNFSEWQQNKDDALGKIEKEAPAPHWEQWRKDAGTKKKQLITWTQKCRLAFFSKIHFVAMLMI